MIRKYIDGSSMICLGFPYRRTNGTDWPRSGAVKTGIAALEHELMTRVIAARHIWVGAAFLGIAIATTVQAQTAPAGGPPGPPPPRPAAGAPPAALALFRGAFL